ncbi:hypothetical protein KFE25_004620 [Diacronema lutheri]|uniref:Uncharacterized protein n=2 Tax=Diacronema lutheri TaxID=2081491 RepID=A0A8J5XDV2_DIALT|nr:hypothetical protein KFE25_004620 [Diacronema lutheri]
MVSRPASGGPSRAKLGSPLDMYTLPPPLPPTLARPRSAGARARGAGHARAALGAGDGSASAARLGTPSARSWDAPPPPEMAGGYGRLSASAVRDATAARLESAATRLTSRVVLDGTAHAHIRVARSVGRGAAVRIRAEEAIAARVRAHVIDVHRELRALGAARHDVLDTIADMDGRTGLAFACVALRAQLLALGYGALARAGVRVGDGSPRAFDAFADIDASSADCDTPGAPADDAPGDALAAEGALLDELQRALRRHVGGLEAAASALEHIDAGLYAALGASDANVQHERKLAAAHGAADAVRLVAAKAAAARSGAPRTDGGGGGGGGGSGALGAGKADGAVPLLLHRPGGVLDEQTAVLLAAASAACARARAARARVADLCASARAEAKGAALQVLRAARGSVDALASAQLSVRSALLLAAAERRRLEHAARRLGERRDASARTLAGVVETLRRTAAGPHGAHDGPGEAAHGGAHGEGSGARRGSQPSASAALRRSAAELRAAVQALEVEHAAAGAEVRRVEATEAALCDTAVRIGKAVAIEEECNNAFDPAAAAVVYGFCFAQGIRMSVVSRDAVPLLPMQLARSFAVRTKSEVLRYLANAQFLGLAGLWKKLCAGQLPARCDKAWYFATFCGVDGAEFERRALCELDEGADVLGYLNGFVKPYDVIAAMTVLPTTAGWFSPAAEVMVNGTAHRLLLRAEHAIDVRSVHNLLRETYHSVALLDADPLLLRRVSLRSRLLGSRARAGAAVHPGVASPSSKAVRATDGHGGSPPLPHVCASAHGARPPGQRAPASLDCGALHVATTQQRSSAASPLARARTLGGEARDRVADAFRVLPPDASSQVSASSRVVSRRRVSLHGSALRQALPHARARGWQRSVTMEDEQLRTFVASRHSAASVVELLHADRLRSADGAASHELTAELLAQSVAAARVRQTVVMLRVLALMVPVCAATLALALATGAAVAASEPEDVGGEMKGAGGDQIDITSARASSVTFDRSRILLISIGYGVTGNLITLCFQPVPEHRTRLIGAILFGDVVIAGAAVPYALAFARLAPRLWAGWVAGDALKATLFFNALAALLQVASNAFVLVCRYVWLWRYRSDVQRLLLAKWRSLVLLYSGIAVASSVTFIGRASSGSLRDTIDAEGDSRGVLAAFLVFAPIPVNMLFAAFAACHRLQRRAQALIAAPGSGMQGVVASLAPLVGYGSAKGERSATELHAEARTALRGVVLDAAGLDALISQLVEIASASAYNDAVRALYPAVIDELALLAESEGEAVGSQNGRTRS